MNSRQRFLAACRREPVDAVPGWVMRQAGRYLPEYRAARAGHEFLDMVRDPALASEVTCQPMRRFDMDAAVIFSDILVPCAAMGQAVSFREGEGPSLEPCVRSRADVDRLKDFDAKTATGFLAEAIRRTRMELGDAKAIIGFCGAPWTTASYMIEGESSRNFEQTKKLVYGELATFERLCSRLVDNLVPYLAMQVDAGADVLQIFDSWGGALDAATYRRVLLPHVKRLVAGAKATGAPVILYVNGCAQLLEVLADAEPDVIGLDWRVDVADAMKRVGSRVALQGNLDPCALFAGPDVVEREVVRTLDSFAAQKGYIFNLGSGILPGVPVESMETVFRVLRSRRPDAGRASKAGSASSAAGPSPPAASTVASEKTPDLLGSAERERLRKLLASTEFGGALPEDTVDSILERMNEIRTQRLVKPTFRVDQPVRVKDGAFAGSEGRITAIDEPKGTIRASITVSGRSTEVELDWWLFELR